MNTLRRLIKRASHVGRGDERLRGASSFDRYYGRVAGQGEGYPTADEARRDMLSQRDLMIPFGWPR